MSKSKVVYQAMPYVPYDGRVAVAVLPHSCCWCRTTNSRGDTPESYAVDGLTAHLPDFDHEACCMCGVRRLRRDDG